METRCLYLVLLLSFHQCAGLGITPAKPPGLARRERLETPATPYLRSNDAVIQASSLAEVNSESAVQSGYDTDTDNKVCNYDFVNGQAGTLECRDPFNHQPILNETVCKMAADYRGIPRNQTGFKKDASEWDLHPQGCFQERCGYDDPDGRFFTSSECYFFNPPKASGFPSCHTDWSCGGELICRRLKYVRAPISTIAGQMATCPSGFQPIADQQGCNEAATCLDIGERPTGSLAAQIQQTPSSFPYGCFTLPENSPGYACCKYHRGYPDIAMNVNNALNFQSAPMCIVANAPGDNSQNSPSPSA